MTAFQADISIFPLKFYEETDEDTNKGHKILLKFLSSGKDWTGKADIVQNV